MPLGTTRDDRGVRFAVLFWRTMLSRELTGIYSCPQEYEEIMIPAPKAVPFRFDEALLPIDQMDAWGKRTFHVSSRRRLRKTPY